jgi:hypothetical protein
MARAAGKFQGMQQPRHCAIFRPFAAIPYRAAQGIQVERLRRFVQIGGHG